LVALIGKVTKLFLQVSERNGPFSSGKYLTDEILKLINRRIKPLCCLLQSLGLSHGDFPPFKRRSLLAFFHLAVWR
jgi:hypothetical protein